MAKIRNNYEKSWFPRLLKWLDGGSGLLDDAMAHELDEASEEHLLPDNATSYTHSINEKHNRSLYKAHAIVNEYFTQHDTH